jgi:hypothetical protein
MKQTALLIGILAFGLLSANAQDCRLQIRFAGITPAKYYTVLKISFSPTTNSCAGVRAAVEWSDDLVTWHPVSQPGGLPCVTVGAEVQVVDETDARTRSRRFYRVRHSGACP